MVIGGNIFGLKAHYIPAQGKGLKGQRLGLE